jgi:dipeptidyl aminopeptidase/acylaminoacyl peptidase
MAARGYAVLFTNPHGSRGYGQEFTAATHHDWGGKDYQDLMKGVDHALSLGTVDEQRLGIAGGSFGGYMTNWAIGHTDRFKAAVTMRSTCNRYSMFTTNDIGFMHGSFEFDGNPWDNPDMYLKHSPITYVENVDTPLLMIHSENDHRCPIEQAEQFFTALKWLKKEVQLVIFPNEHHGLSRQGKPEHRVERLDRIMEWFDEWIGGE